MKLYGKKNAIAALRAMQSSQRMPHAILLYGDAGLGKKTLARYLCAMMLCTQEKAENKPCMQCASCRKMLAGNHPDVTQIEHYGKRGGYEVARLQALSVEAYIRPNDGDVKIYLFDDCDAISVQCQNILLKLIEEPPAHCRFLFTAKSPAGFLPTVLSRLAQIPVDGASEQDCVQALMEIAPDLDKQAASDAALAFHGNIGRALVAAQDPTGLQALQSARTIASAIAARDEYALLLALEKIQKDKPLLLSALTMTAELVRDAVAFALDGQAAIGSDAALAEKLSSRISAKRADTIVKTLNECAQSILQNGNVPLMLGCAAGRLVS